MQTIGRRLLLLAASLGVAQACAIAPAPVVPVRVIIGFAEPVDGAAPATLARLAAFSGADFVFLSSLSPRSHAYQLRCPANDPDCARTLTTLKAHHSIEYLSPDTLKDSR